MSLNLVTLPVLGACLTRRLERVHKWTTLPVSAWLLLIIYVDSFLFIFVTALLKDIGLNKTAGICDGGILLCLVCYMSTKVLIYTFLWVVRGCLQRRRESKLYLFNCFGMLLPYGIMVVLNFVWRIAYIDVDGKCIIGMEKRAMMPLIIFDAVVNLYLNTLFIVPLRKMYSFQHGNGKMRVLAFRTFVGSCATLVSSVVNLTVLMAVSGEPGWMCLMLCNADILFCVLVLHWATKFDSGGSTHNASCGHPSHDPIASTPSTRLPEPVVHKRCNFFTHCEEDFPEGCLKHHPWEAAKVPHSHTCSTSPCKSQSDDIQSHDLRPTNTQDSEEEQMGIERALKLLTGPPREKKEVKEARVKEARAAGKC
ncbi:hypothetical protein M409DRAFT_28970 [Zasmidium cellare ATCC 36951]|uniref:Transmembrane protein n=1 Tax=Zasmidium cellare ATCC 36951 TaxID=1080233 RepID=A0A6A6C0K5_ZASCE|nr:uncharacterized protein M409DRAFT_28970 [Zasmidium cellare ATCC 36951]KAF2160584.1 hypothetical protein M409DRAFT_28970 [Zasmidium cellare ATCC 36951]